MFSSEVYVNRRRSLLAQMASRGAQGIAVFLGNVDAATNYRGNDYKFRQDSNFLYFWGVDEPCFAAVLDLDNATECLYGNDVTSMISSGWAHSLQWRQRVLQSDVQRQLHWLSSSRL